MKSKNTAFRETGPVAIGQLACTAAMVAVFALIGRFQLSVLLGGIAGAVIATANFFIMSFVANLAADKAEAQDVAGGKRLLKTSMLVRYAVLFLVLFACAKSGLFNKIALVVPLVFVRPTLTLAEFFRKKEAR